MTIRDGGLASPIAVNVGDGATAVEMGMSLRDYFAAKAIGFASVDPFIMAFTAGAGPAVSAEMLAEYAYRIADAMLAKRAK